MGRMKNPFGACFARGKKDRRKESRKAAQEIPGKEEEEEQEEESIPLRYPLFDPRAVKTREEDLGEEPLSRPNSIPLEMATREHIELPADEEEDDNFMEDNPVLEEELPEEGKSASTVEEERAPSPVEEPARAPVPPPAKEELTPPAEEVEKTPPTPPPSPPPVEVEKVSPPPPSSPHSPQPSVSPEPVKPEPMPVSPPPKAREQYRAPIPEPAPPSPPVEETREESESRTSSPSVVSVRKVPEEPLNEPVFTPPPVIEEEPQMSPFEKLESAREGSLSDSAPTAPHTPRGPSDDDMARRIQAKLAELERQQTLAEVTYYRKKKRRSRCRLRPRWVCVEKAIDCYADAHDDFTAFFRERMNVHEKKDCGICRDFDFSDIPVLQ